MRVVGTFSGIGGLELPFDKRHTHETVLLCDWWEPSQQVLTEHFDAEIEGDIRTLATRGLPADIDVLTAGFPCTDLSQAGRTAGIAGEQSGMVRYVFDLLRDPTNVSYLVLENVRNMLVLDKGGAMNFLVDKLEELGFRWAYRLVDSRFTGVPQRRHRVVLVASRGGGVDPRHILFADNAPEPDHVQGAHLRHDAFGFYWTEGLRGLGWAVDAVPPLKGGSSVGIPSTPGIWLPDAPPGRRLATPTIEHAEALQGFEPGWTKPADLGGRNGPRWKLVGNAVTVGVSDWLVNRLDNPGDLAVETTSSPLGDRWPDAAWGDGSGGRFKVDCSTWPTMPERYTPLTEICSPDEVTPMTARSAGGFLSRLRRGSLRRDPAFEHDVEEHISLVVPGA